MGNHAKDEALRALEHIRKRLADWAPLEGMERAQLRATVVYAAEQVAAIQEVKRRRPESAAALAVAVVDPGAPAAAEPP